MLFFCVIRYRFNKSGKLVTTYGDFVEYLLEKYAPSGEDTDDGIQAVEMDFEVYCCEYMVDVFWILTLFMYLYIG